MAKVHDLIKRIPEEIAVGDIDQAFSILLNYLESTNSNYFKEVRQRSIDFHIMRKSKGRGELDLVEYRMVVKEVSTYILDEILPKINKSIKHAPTSQGRNQQRNNNSAQRNRSLTKREKRQLAARYTRNRQFNSAIDLLNELLQEDNEDKKALFELGKIYRRQGDTYRAIDFFKRGLEIEKGNKKVMNELGMCHREIHEFDEAISLFKSIINDNKKDIRAINELVICYREKGDFKQAFDYIEQGKKIEAGNNHLAFNKVLINLFFKLDGSGVLKTIRNYERFFGKLILNEKHEIRFITCAKFLSEIWDLQADEELIEDYFNDLIYYKSYENIRQFSLRLKQKGKAHILRLEDTHHSFKMLLNKSKNNHTVEQTQALVRDALIIHPDDDYFLNEQKKINHYNFVDEHLDKQDVQKWEDTILGAREYLESLKKSGNIGGTDSKEETVKQLVAAENAIINHFAKMIPDDAKKKAFKESVVLLDKINHQNTDYSETEKARAIVTTTLNDYCLRVLETLNTSVVEFILMRLDINSKNLGLFKKVERIEKYEAPLTCDEDFQIPIQQYLAFFPTFFEIIHAQKMNFEVRKKPQGLSIQLRNLEIRNLTIVLSEIQKYLSLAKQKEEKWKQEIETLIQDKIITQEKFEYLLLSLKVEKTSLENKFDALTVKYQRLSESHQLLEQKITSLESQIDTEKDSISQAINNGSTVIINKEGGVIKLENNAQMRIKQKYEGQESIEQIFADEVNINKP